MSSTSGKSKVVNTCKRKSSHFLVVVIFFQSKITIKDSYINLAILLKGKWFHLPSTIRKYEILSLLFFLLILQQHHILKDTSEKLLLKPFHSREWIYLRFDGPLENGQRAILSMSRRCYQFHTWINRVFVLFTQKSWLTHGYVTTWTNIQ